MPCPSWATVITSRWTLLPTWGPFCSILHSVTRAIFQKDVPEKNNPVISRLLRNLLLGLRSWQKSIWTSWCEVQGICGQPCHYLSSTLLPLAPHHLLDPCLKHYFNEYSYYWICCALSSFCAFVSGDPSQKVLISYSLIHLFPVYFSDIIKVEPYLKGSLTSIHRPPPNKVRFAFVAVEAYNRAFVLFFFCVCVCDFLFMCWFLSLPDATLLEGKVLTYFCFLVHRVEPDTVGIHKCLLNLWIK